MRRKFRIRGLTATRGFAGGRWLGLTAGLLLVSAVCSAQYKAAVTAAVDSVQKAGFYRIVLPPAFVAECRADISDLRIFDETGDETPFVLKADPLDPMNAGFLAIPDPRISRQDSGDRHSYYWLQYDKSYRIERLSFVITQPVLYKRTAVISNADGTTDREVATISIDPTDTAFRIPPVKAKRLLVDISNQDNAPLAISRVVTAQSGIYVFTLLSPAGKYVLAAGDPSIRAPDYDLHYFTDSLGEIPVTIGLGMIRPGRGGMPVIRRDKGGQPVISKPAGENTGSRSGLLLWALVAVILLLLLYVSIKLARAVDKKGEE